MIQLDAPFFATLSLCAGPILFLRSFRDLRLRRLIQHTPTARIRSMAMGLAEVNGVVSARRAIAAPFSGRACVFWDVDISVPRRRAGWTVVHRDHSGQPFLIDDGTATAWIYPRGAESRLRFTQEEVCAGVALPECYARYMSERGLLMRHLWRIGVMRFRERVLEEGERVYVLGSAEPRGRAITISDGDVEAEAATGTDGPRTGRGPRPTDPEPVAVIRRGAHEPAFLISQAPERELVLDMGLQALAKLALGPALTLFGLLTWIAVLSRGPFR